MATIQETQQLDRLLQVIRESAIQIIDNKSVSNVDLISFMYGKGLSFVTDKSMQTIVDIGSIGLAYAVRSQNDSSDGSQR